MMKTSATAMTKLALLGAILMVSGCGSNGPAVVPVTGIVTANGKPLADVLVEFVPQEEGWGSRGKTASDGTFELYYRDGQKGAEAVKHRVRISTLVEKDKDSSNPVVQNGRPEMLPPEYNQETTLEADLTSAQPADLKFDLEIHPKLMSMMERYQRKIAAQ